MGFVCQIEEEWMKKNQNKEKKNQVKKETMCS